MIDTETVRRSLERHRLSQIVRLILLVYLSLVLCPLQYLALSNDVENSWLFCLNYGAAHHWSMGRDIVWTSGPLAYLAAPMDIGSNLVYGISFQAILWLVFILVLSDIFLRESFPVRNLIPFAVCVGLSGPQYHELPNPLGLGSLLFVAALILLVHYELRGGEWRFISGLTLLGLVPLFQFVGVLLAIGTIVLLVLHRLMFAREAFRREAILATSIPVAVSAFGYAVSIGSWRDLMAYFSASVDLVSGYNLGMSLRGAPAEIVCAFEATALLAVLIGVVASQNLRTAAFLLLLVAAPVALNFKHSFVRQDQHVVYVFAFVASAMGLVFLAVQFTPLRLAISALAFSLFCILCLIFVIALNPHTTLDVITGRRIPAIAWHALRFGSLRQDLHAQSVRNSTEDDLIAPEILTLIQEEKVAPLSQIYTNLQLARLNFVIYPVIQRYSAYTPYLDQLNADWIREKGPKFLLFDGKSIDGRDPWLETPAMWLEVYRWYDARLLTAHNLLLQRRKNPRFQQLSPVGQRTVRFGENMTFPHAPEPVFWTLHCSLTGTGKLRNLVFRISDVDMTSLNRTGQSQPRRILPSVLSTPSIGSRLPQSLQDFATVLDPVGGSGPDVQGLTFGGPGSASYAPSCEAQFFVPTM